MSTLDLVLRIGGAGAVLTGLVILVNQVDRTRRRVFVLEDRIAFLDVLVEERTRWDGVERRGEQRERG